jgi:hypothetical protein
MLAAQMLAAHDAAMECYRRAMIGEQSFEGRRENLNQANKLTRTHTTLVEALNRHRGKGQQIVRVERVTVHEGGQAIVGPVHLACRCSAKSKRSGLRCQSPAVRGHNVCRMHGASGGTPKGNNNALKHGLYSAKAIEGRQFVRELIRLADELMEKI